MVPALAVGFEDLKKRMESQNEMTEIQRVKLDEIEGKMNEIMQFHLLQTAAKVREFKRRHIQLSQRVLTVRHDPLNFRHFFKINLILRMVDTLSNICPPYTPVWLAYETCSDLEESRCANSCR